MEIKKAFKIIEESIDEADFVGAINAESIKLSEEELDVKFPQSYKEFLKKYGCGDIFSIEFFGIVSDDEIDAEGIPNVVWLTKDLRKDGLSKGYIPVSETGDGLYYVLDTNKVDNNNECPVLLWAPGNLKTEIAYEDFGSFLFDILGGNE